MSLHRCGCVEFFIARDQNTRICGLSDLSCSYDVMLNFLMPSETNSGFEECECHSDCNLIEYQLKVIETTIGEEQHWITVNNQSYWTGTTYNGGLSFAFGDNEYTALKRYTSYESISFISDVGGLLGLFVGVSFMSVIEVFYFLFIRFTVEFVKHVKQRRSKSVKKGAVDISATLKELEC